MLHDIVNWKDTLKVATEEEERRFYYYFQSVQLLIKNYQINAKYLTEIDTLSGSMKVTVK